MPRNAADGHRRPAGGMMRDARSGKRLTQQTTGGAKK